MNSRSELEEMIELAKRRGFFWPSFSIYGGFSGFNDYAPLGAILMDRLYTEWKNTFSSIGGIEIDTPNITPETVLKASGHVDKFIDLAVTCSKCKNRFKLENVLLDSGVEKLPENVEESKIVLLENNYKCPKCGERLLDPYEFHLMFKTNSGSENYYLRPETAQGIFVNFKLLLNFNRGKLPLIVYQRGKGYRNEISPRQGVIRQKEFNMAEVEVFMEEDKESTFIPNLNEKLVLLDNKATEHNITLMEALKEGIIASSDHAYFLQVIYTYAMKVGLDPERLRFRQHRKDELAHYSRDCWDLEVKIDNSWLEITGISDRGTYDISKHVEKSGENLFYEGEKIPKVIEPASGMDRVLSAVLVSGMKKRESGYNYLSIPANIAPYRVAILPLQKKDGLLEKAREIFEKIRLSEPYSQLDESGAIGRRYARQDEIGTPYCITVDYDTLEKDVVTIRERDSTKQIKGIKVEELYSPFSFLYNSILQKFKEI
jgi:glycyl-tRNA synthetase